MEPLAFCERGGMLVFRYGQAKAREFAISDYGQARRKPGAGTRSCSYLENSEELINRIELDPHVGFDGIRELGFTFVWSVKKNLLPHESIRKCPVQLSSRNYLSHQAARSHN